MDSKIERNKYWSVILGWKPGDFACVDFDATLVKVIREFQKADGLDADGIAGPMTWRRRVTQRESLVKGEDAHKVLNAGLGGFLHGGGIVQSGGLQILPVAALGLPLDRGFKLRPKPIRGIVLHWDACLSEKSCLEVLRQSGYATHFVVGNGHPDMPVAPVYQILDTIYKAAHSGTKRNDDTIGIDVSNAVYLKYQAWYESHGFGARPLASDMVHGMHCSRDGAILGMYPRQVEALKRLIKILCGAFDIPFVYPKDEDGRPIRTFHAPCLASFEGVMQHYQLTPQKIDIAGFPFNEVFEEE